MTERKLVVSLHDVTPFHAGRLERAERFLASLAISPITYLLVPDFHRRAAAHTSDEFVAWCRTPRRFDVQWFLHGYFHHEDPAELTCDRRVSAAAWVAGKVLTAGEGEFLTLRGEALRARIGAGVRSFEQCLGTAPSGFVAPAWLFNGDLIPTLKGMRFRFTESHLKVFQLQTNRARTSPVITWATRTRLRQYASIVGSMTLCRLWRTRPVLRIALHPYDFDHPSTLASIERTFDLVRTHRVQTGYEDGLFDL